MKPVSHQSFPDAEALGEWMAGNHASATELWVRIYKSASGKTSVTWGDCVVEAIRYGWIDGQKKPLDDSSYLQRLSPRKAGSNWSRKNREHAKQLIEEGRMAPAGLAQVEAAQKDGRWEKAYAGSADMEIPEDFLTALNKLPRAKRFFATLNKQNLFSIYYRLHSAKKPETRAKRMAQILAMLDKGTKLHYGLLLGALAIICGFRSGTQRSVAITIDDLPYATAGDHSPTEAVRPQADSINRAIIATLVRRHVPATGFVIQARVEQLGGSRILRAWTDAHLDLGNHSYSHPDFNRLSVAEIEDEIVRGETSLTAPRYLRFPFNHDGDTRTKHDSIAAFLAHRGYQIATCTIQNDDWLFSRRYVRALDSGDTIAAARVRAAYLDYTKTEIGYYAGLSQQVLGYEPPQVMLLHDNKLNADVLSEVLDWFQRAHYRFVTLATAQKDPAYQIPDTVVTPDGPMWAYRWARSRHVSVNGSLEQEPPAWLTQ